MENNHNEKDKFFGTLNKFMKFIYYICVYGIPVSIFVALLATSGPDGNGPIGFLWAFLVGSASCILWVKLEQK